MMTYSQPLSNYNYSHYPVAASKAAGRKQLAAAAADSKYFGGSHSDTNPHTHYSPTTSSISNPRTLPPYISVQRASEPASPATIATTISSSHSTPSPSPSRLPNLSTAVTHDADFTLFDDAIVAVDQEMGSSAPKGRVGIDVQSTMSDGAPGLTSYSSAGFPIIVPHDASYSNYTQSGMYNNYATGAGFPPSDASGDLYNFNSNGNDRGAVSQPPLQQLSSSRLLHPSRNNGSSTLGRHSSGQLGNTHDVESIENVPALSPTSKQQQQQQQQAGLPPHRRNNRPSSPLSPTARIASQNSGFQTPNYLHSAMPKLGRTYSDAAQDELYNPDLTRQHRSSKMKASTGSKSKQENRNSLPQIFQEAQQQHEQDFYRNNVHDVPPRDQSPFRQNSPFHPTNTVTVAYPSTYSGHTREIPDNDLRDDINQNQQLAIALALRDQMQKSNNQQPQTAPKTISPRDSLLEYHEPENASNHLNLFPPISGGRMLAAAAAAGHDITGPGSIHGSQDGSDLDDFQSMATSRRGSIANSSGSSHLDVPRFSMMQTSYDPSSATSYYYTDSAAIGGGLPLLEQQQQPFIKTEATYNPIPRPLETTANSGTYTCTYSGCGHRFTTSTKLQKHRRESHRKTAPSGNSVSSAAAIACRNAQPGPHRCMRVNPSTGKPCNTVFSRPYDLTRHEDTIHNSAKAKVRCEICNDDKTFSRGDALVRHRRVKHNIS